MNDSMSKMIHKVKERNIEKNYMETYNRIQDGKFSSRGKITKPSYNERVEKKLE